MIKIRQEAIAIFTLVIWCIGVESLPGVREKRQTEGCSYYNDVKPTPKRYQVFYQLNRDRLKWQEAREACQDLGGDLAEFLNRQEEDKIMKAIYKFPGGAWQMYYWIGVKTKKETTEAIWVSGRKMEFDSDLKFSRENWWGNDRYGKNRCGAIHYKGIKDFKCTSFAASGYVCEFASNGSIEFCKE